MDCERSRLKWRCRRGMRELDMVVCAYLETRYDHASERERAAFRRMLDLPDPQLFGFLTGRETPADLAMAHLVDTIRTYRLADPKA